MKKGLKFFLIHVGMDLELESAFEAELILLLIAVDMARGKDVIIHSDCKSALALVNSQIKGGFVNICSGWKKPLGCELSKVRAHPERYKNPEVWSDEDKGIWIADQVAGRTTTPQRYLKASKWLSRIAYSSKAIVVEKNKNIPFFRDVSRRWGKHAMERYFHFRDLNREENGKDKIWGGANMGHSYKMMGRWKGLADRAAVQRAALDKRWRWH